MQNREIRLRVSPQLMADITHVAKLHEIPITNVVKLALNSYLRSYKAEPVTNAKLTLPPEWLEDD